MHRIELCAAVLQRGERAVPGLLGLNCVNNPGSGKEEKSQQRVPPSGKKTGRAFCSNDSETVRC